ncbi:hypothetical protein BGW80DRAFT_1295582 [Lactifluus volemus]|nr:hypothetical protein BGW80DRAFT_1295582 [Lactifluus volemus]
MAFPVPSHLPRKPPPQDVSSLILSKISSTDVKTLSTEVAASWVAELDQAILESKTKIHDRLHENFSLFEQQLASSTAVQERLTTLTANVNELSDAVSHPEFGIIPTLLRELSAHATLAQQTQDAETKYDAMECLLRCRKEYDSLSSLSNEGRLVEAVAASTQLQNLLDAAPPALTGTEVFSHLKVAFRTARDRVEEQLTDAYSRSVVLSRDELTTRRSVLVRDSTTVLTLSSILSSLSATSLSDHLALLRRDVNTYYIHRLLTQPTSLSPSSSKDSSGILSDTLSFLPSPSASEDLSTRLKNLTSVLDFLDAHLFTALPSSHVAISLLPSSLAALPPYLHLVTEAEELEEKYIVGLLGQDPRDHEVKTWTDAVSSHYERKRRAQILENARQLILRGVDIPPPAPPGSSGSEGAADVSDDAWGLEGEESGGTDDLVSAVEEEDAWGFDDGPVEQELAKSGTSPESPPPTETLAGSELATPVDDSAWGWDDSGEEANPPVNTSPTGPSSGNSADWDDDPWGGSVPKPASRLEKLANKAKAKAPPSATSTSAMKSPAAAARPPPPHAPSRPSKPVETSNVTLPGKKEETKPITQADSYAISKHAQQLADIVDAILNEGEEFAAATIFDFDSKTPPTQARGLMISQTAPAALDLFRALYPVKFQKQSTEPKSIVYANDCIYARKRWFEQSIETQQRLGFIGTAEQERYDECEEAVMGVLSQGVLNKTKYFDALGNLVNFCLTCIMDDVLALSDITEVESHRLSELCRILHALEGLFMDDPEQPSFVVACVPAWLKFSYLSELLEANLADISYLFDEGALIDYESQELVKLVRALFADTPQRANMIHKLMVGHPHSP